MTGNSSPKLSQRSKPDPDIQMSITLPELPYSTDALEPVVSAKTLELHHRRHHISYADNLNKAIDDEACEGQLLETTVSAAGVLV